MSRNFDVIVLGLGGMGSAAVQQLAARGQRVLGLDQFTPPHTQGSSHGKTRVIRQAYFEDPAYVPLLLRAYELWRDLERASGESLLRVTGGLMMGELDSAVFTGSLRSARQHGLPHEVLDARELQKRYPQFRPTPTTQALFEKSAGYVMPETTVAAALKQATRAGATLRLGERVTGWTAKDGVSVTTTHGTYTADQLVVSAGPWISAVLPELAAQFVVERKVLYWFEPTGGVAAFSPDQFPIWIWQTADRAEYYGFPANDGATGGVKVAGHHGIGPSVCTPDNIDRQVTPAEIDRMRQAMSTRLPALTGPCLATATCMYTNTRDQHFLLDRHPQHPQVLICSPCSGHGFKFVPVIGEIVADLVVARSTRHDIRLFRLDRF